MPRQLSLDETAAPRVPQQPSLKKLKKPQPAAPPARSTTWLDAELL
jgi:hypothetical protein